MPEGSPRAPAAALPSASAVPDGASRFPRWWISSTSMSKAGGRVAALWRTSSVSSATAMLVFAATMRAISPAAALIAGSRAVSSPVVPMRSGLAAARQAATFAAVASAWLKSIATSASASAPGRSLVTARFVGARPATSPASRPSARLALDATAPVMRSCGNAGAALSSACPMRPVTPITTMRARGALRGSEAILSPSGFAALGSEEALHALEKAPLARRVLVRVRLQRLLERADQVALLGGEVHGGLDDHPAEEVAARAAAHWLYALVAQAKDAP